MEKQKEVKQRGIQKIICAVVAVAVLIGLIVIASAAEEKEIYATYDQNELSEEYKEVVIPNLKEEEIVESIRTYVYNQDGARLEEEGELVTVELLQGRDYVIRETFEEVLGEKNIIDAEEKNAEEENEETEESAEATEVEEQEKEIEYEIVFQREYLNALLRGEYTFLLDLEVGEEKETKEYIVEIKDSSIIEEAEPEDLTAEAEEQAELMGTTESEVTEEEPKESTEPEFSMQPFDLGEDYEITLLSTSMAEAATLFRFRESEGTGTLRAIINLQGSGETDRYIIIRLPIYGMVLSEVLPQIETGMTAVTKIDDRTLRLDIADGATQVLNVDIAYVRVYLSAEMDAAWRSGTVPPSTGFAIEVYGKSAGVEKTLNQKKYGNWFIDLSGSKDMGIVSNTDVIGTMSPFQVPTERIEATAGVTRWNSFGSIGHLRWNIYSDRRDYQPWHYNVLGRGIDQDADMRAQYLKQVNIYMSANLYNATNIDKARYPLLTNGSGTYIEWLKFTSGQSALGGTGNPIRFDAFAFTPEGIRDNLQANTNYQMRAELIYGEYRTTGVTERAVMQNLGSFRTAAEAVTDLWRVGANYRTDGKNGLNYINDRGNTAFRTAYDFNNHFAVVKGRSDRLFVSDYGNTIHLNGNTSRIPANKYAGLTVRYDFPYELQPREFYPGFSKYVNGWEPMNYLGDVDLYYDMIITYSDGSQITRAKQMIEGTTQYESREGLDRTITLPQKTGERITSIEIVWEEFWTNYGYQALELHHTELTSDTNNEYRNMVGTTNETIKPGFGVNVMDTYANGSPIPAGTMARINVTIREGNGTIKEQSTNNQLCFFLYDEASGCPIVRPGGPETSDWKVQADNNERQTNLTLRTTFATGYSRMRETINNPRLVIGIMDSIDYPEPYRPFHHLNIIGNERVGYFMTGKMRVYSMLAGWRVNYATRNSSGTVTQRTMLLPDTIETEGYWLELNIPAGERLASSSYVDGASYSGIVFSKDGPVSGWRTGIDMVGHIEMQSPTQKDDGSSFEAAGNEGKLHSMGRVFAVLTNSDCNCEAHTASAKDHTTPSLGDVAIYGQVIPGARYGIIYAMGEPYDYLSAELLIGFQSIFHMNKGAGYIPELLAADIYQNASATVKLGGEKVITSTNNLETVTEGGRLPIPFFKSDFVNNYAEKWQKTIQPTIYAKVINPDILVTEGYTTMNIEIASATWATNPEYHYPGSLEPRSISVPAIVEVILDGNWDRWVKVTALDAAELSVGYRWKTKTINVTADVDLFAIPGATVGGNQPLFEKWYIEDELESWESIYNGSEAADYGTMRVNDRVVDTLNITGTGDVTTPRLYEYAGYPINVYTQVFSGVNIYPGVGNSYGLADRQQDFYPSGRNDLVALVNLVTDNSALENYETVYELPRKDKQLPGTFYNSLEGETTVTSEVDIYLRGPVTERSNSSGVVTVISYRIGNAWYTEAQVASNGGWDAVTAFRITTDELPALTTLNMDVPLRANEKTTLDPLDAYIGGTIKYEIAGLGTEVNMIFAHFTYKSYSLTGTVWNDVNEDGKKAMTDEVLSGYQVDLKKMSDNSVVGTATTGADGKYEIIVNEDTDLYLEITLPSGKKLTRQLLTNAGAYLDDSDYDRTTNRYEIDLLTGSIVVDAGIITLPVIHMDDYILEVGETRNITGTRTGGYTPSISYTPADDTIATLADTTGVLPTSQPTATVNGLKEGVTVVTMTATNSLGDTVTTTFKITVGEKEVALDLTKELETVAIEESVFVFQIERLSDTNQVEQVFYQTIKIPAGVASGTIRIGGLQPGVYRVTEVQNNWRYSIVGSIGRIVIVTDPDVPGAVTFTNKLDNMLWSSGKADVTNTMKRVE